MFTSFFCKYISLAQPEAMSDASAKQISLSRIRKTLETLPHIIRNVLGPNVPVIFVEKWMALLFSEGKEDSLDKMSCTHLESLRKELENFTFFKLDPYKELESTEHWKLPVQTEALSVYCVKRARFNGHPQTRHFIFLMTVNKVVYPLIIPFFRSDHSVKEHAKNIKIQLKDFRVDSAQVSLPVEDPTLTPKKLEASKLGQEVSTVRKRPDVASVVSGEIPLKQLIELSGLTPATLREKLDESAITQLLQCENSKDILVLLREPEGYRDPQDWFCRSLPLILDEKGNILKKFKSTGKDVVALVKLRDSVSSLFTQIINSNAAERAKREAQVQAQREKDQEKQVKLARLSLLTVMGKPLLRFCDSVETLTLNDGLDLNFGAMLRNGELGSILECQARYKLAELTSFVTEWRDFSVNMTQEMETRVKGLFCRFIPGVCSPALHYNSKSGLWEFSSDMSESGPHADAIHGLERVNSPLRLLLTLPEEYCLSESPDYVKMRDLCSQKKKWHMVDYEFLLQNLSKTMSLKDRMAIFQLLGRQAPFFEVCRTQPKVFKFWLNMLQECVDVYEEQVVAILTHASSEWPVSWISMVFKEDRLYADSLLKAFKEDASVFRVLTSHVYISGKETRSRKTLLVESLFRDPNRFVETLLLVKNAQDRFDILWDKKGVGVAVFSAFSEWILMAKADEAAFYSAPPQEFIERFVKLLPAHLWVESLEYPVLVDPKKQTELDLIDILGSHAMNILFGILDHFTPFYRAYYQESVAQKFLHKGSTQMYDAIYARLGEDAELPEKESGYKDFCDIAEKGGDRGLFIFFERVNELVSLGIPFEFPLDRLKTIMLLGIQAETRETQKLVMRVIRKFKPKELIVGDRVFCRKLVASNNLDAKTCTYLGSFE